ncbi:unnamed protein product, partial [Pylaiella littoralis]
MCADGAGRRSRMDYIFISRFRTFRTWSDFCMGLRLRLRSRLRLRPLLRYGYGYRLWYVRPSEIRSVTSMLNRQDFSACFREQFAFWSFRVAFFTLRYSFAVFVVVKSQWRSGSSVGVPARCVTCMFTQGIDNG